MRTLSVPDRIEADNVEEIMSGIETSIGPAVAAQSGAAIAPDMPPRPGDPADPAGAVGSIVLDLGALERFDSSALSMLLELSRRHGGPVQVLNPPAKLSELAELYGVDELLFGRREQEAGSH